jgi:hypothetical protein
MSQSGATDLVRVADIAWRTREALHLAMPAMASAGVLDDNLTAAINDLNDAMPLSEEGPDWRHPAKDPVMNQTGAGEIDSFSDVAEAITMDEAWRYGFRWGPLVVERTAHIEGRGYVVTIRTERQSMQVYVSEKGHKIEPMRVRDA